MGKVKELINTGSEILTGYSQHQKNVVWNGFSRNWNLLLTVKGEGKLLYNGRRCILPEFSLALVAPDDKRQFETEVPWACLWIHFDNTQLIYGGGDWPEIIPGVRLLRLGQEDFHVIHYVFLQVTQVAAKKEQGWKQLLYCLIQEIILRGNAIWGRTGENRDSALAQKMLEHLKTNRSMDEVAADCHMSRSAFFSKFSEIFSMSPRKFRERQLMAKVQSLLENTEMSISHICIQVNMSSPFYLSNRFKHYYGIYPKEYRRQFRSALQNPALGSS